MLRLIAAQRIGPRIWLSARIAAIGLWMAPLVLASLILALCWAGVDARAAWPELAAAAALSLAYLGLWLALAFLVLAAWPSAAGAVGSLVALWAALAIGVPLAADAYARTRYPMPSATALVDAQRRGNDAIAAQRDAIAAAAFARRSDLIGASDRVGSLDYATRMTFLAPELERRLSRLEAQRQAARDGRAQASAFAAYLSPPLGLQSALAQLAGTDAQRHRRFETQVRDYQQRLRDWFYPRIQRQIAAPTPRPAQSRGRQNFGEYDAIPAWAGREPGSEARLRAVLPALLWLALLAAALSFWALRRLRHWPMED
ncbi:DUF3526 domain-containing protein [Lysobacter silvisoli]|uniref:DUF3526 domain-containing protein n=1 Tax=Lysobacter silvisoli TaxID=2293254 RepID=A0A371JWU6_9GAMM|nr:DUF3526 domain-containing protein [Lysobacter silvisoli]RDZ26094.1 DUF3526 domain-containing protein [Lysobacter silvisoli]